VGIRDTALSECLQMDAELDLEKAKKMIRGCERPPSIITGWWVESYG